MDVGVDPVKCPPHGVGIANVSDLELDVRREVLGPGDAFMNLRRQVVERADAVSVREQLVGEVRADEARAAGDED